MSKSSKKANQKGDTLVEVILAMAIFAVVSLLAINLMNDGLMTAQKNLETTMAKNAMDSQAETLRYLYNSYLKESASGSSNGGTNFTKVWKNIILEKVAPTGWGAADLNQLDSCEDGNPVGKFGTMSDTDKAFVVNPRGIITPNGAEKNTLISYYGVGTKDTKMNPNNLSALITNVAARASDGKIKPAPAYPRLVYKNMTMNSLNIRTAMEWNADQATVADDYFLNGAGYKNPKYESGDSTSGYEFLSQSNVLAQSEGLWIVAQRGTTGSGYNPEGVNTGFTGDNYYDFYIRTCWNAVGQKTPSTMTSVVRLFNTEVEHQ